MTLEERLFRLEGELARTRKLNRILLMAGAVWAAGLTGLPLVSQEPKNPKAIRGERFELVDSKGKTRAFWGMTQESVEFSLLDENGTARAALGLDPDGPRLILSNDTGKPRAGLLLSKDGAGTLSLLSEHGKQIWSAPR